MHISHHFRARYNPLVGSQLQIYQKTDEPRRAFLFIELLNTHAEYAYHCIKRDYSDMVEYTDESKKLFRECQISNRDGSCHVADYMRHSPLSNQRPIYKAQTTRCRPIFTSSS
jgi:hypothetical protein